MANPLFSTGKPAEMGYPNETFDLPSQVDLDDPIYPEFTGISAGPSEWRSNTGELFQEDAPEYAGKYEVGFENEVGSSFKNESLNPAPGSVDLIAPMDTGSIPGTNRLIKSDGPVDGAGADQGITWTGEQGDLYKPNPNYSGPVAGGPDYANSLARAYYADQNDGFSQIDATSSMVSAV